MRFWRGEIRIRIEIKITVSYDEAMGGYASLSFSTASKKRHAVYGQFCSQSTLCSRVVCNAQSAGKAITLLE
jgi:hypothetical protein